MILITRPLADAQMTAEALKERGYDSIQAPVLRISPLNFTLPAAEEIDALMVTSHNAADLMHHLQQSYKMKPVYAIGRRTTDSLRQAGFSRIIEGSGTGPELTKRLMRDLSPQSRILHLCGRHLSSESEAAKKMQDLLHINNMPVYEALEVTTLPEAVLKALKNQTIHSAIFFSARTLSIFENLCVQHDVTDTLQHIEALCLSPNVLRSATLSYWRDVRAATDPQTDCLYALLDTAAADVSMT